MKQTFSFKVENISKGDVKLSGTEITLTNEMSAEEMQAVGGIYGKLIEAVASVAATIQRLENGEPVQQQNNKSEEETSSNGASFTKSAKEVCKKATKLKADKKRGRKAAKKLEELLKEDSVNEDAQAKAGWDTL